MKSRAFLTWNLSILLCFASQARFSNLDLTWFSTVSHSRNWQISGFVKARSLSTSQAPRSKEAPTKSQHPSCKLLLQSNVKRTLSPSQLWYIWTQYWAEAATAKDRRMRSANGTNGAVRTTSTWSSCTRITASLWPWWSWPSVKDWSGSLTRCRPSFRVNLKARTRSDPCYHTGAVWAPTDTKNENRLAKWHILVEKSWKVWAFLWTYSKTIAKRSKIQSPSSKLVSWKPLVSSNQSSTPSALSNSSPESLGSNSLLLTRS